jgi:serine protease Do
MTLRLNYRVLIGSAFLALAQAPLAQSSFAIDAPSGLSFADVANRVRYSVVTVAAAVVDKEALALQKKGAGSTEEGMDESQGERDFSPSRPKRLPGEPPRQFTSIGSGFVIDASGLIVTNNHVIEGGNAIYVILADGTELKVNKIVGRDSKSDITLLKVTPQASKPLSAVSFGDSSRMRVGDWVLAVGNPFGLDGTVTAGIISGRGRDINAGPYDDFLQTDAAINRGNSGGPLFNANGEVIGINTAIFSPSGGSIGLGFAIPSNTARRIVDQLERYGETRWGWIGVRLQTPSEDVAEWLHLPNGEGALVARVERGSPAEFGGIAVGDVILSFAGSPVLHARQLPRLIAQAQIGEEAEAVVLRGGEQKTLKIKVGQLDETTGNAVANSPHGRPRRQKIGKMSFGPLTPDLRDRFEIKGDAEGAVVTGDTLRFSAEETFQPGDIVLEAAQQRVKTVDELEERLGELRRMSRQEALLTLQRPDGTVYFASLPLGAE